MTPDINYSDVKSSGYITYNFAHERSLIIKSKIKRCLMHLIIRFNNMQPLILKRCACSFSLTYFTFLFPDQCSDVIALYYISYNIPEVKRNTTVKVVSKSFQWFLSFATANISNKFTILGKY